MSFFSPLAGYERGGPGIPKGQKPKHGLELLIEILGREFWSLWGLGLLWLAACLPVVTIGPATAALCRVVCSMVRDQNVYVWKDFWESFRLNWKQGMVLGIPYCGVLGVFLFTAPPFLQTAANSAFLVPVLLLLLLVLSMGCYLFPLLANVSLGVGPLLKNAFFLSIAGGIPSAVAAFLTGAFLLLCLYFMPYSILALLAGVPAFLCLFCTLLTWPVILLHVVEGPEDPAPEE